MTVSPKLIAGAAVVGFLLFGNKKPAKTTVTNETKSDTEKGNKGDPVGPNGCKEGLIEKDGFCVDPTDKNNDTNGTKGNTGDNNSGGSKIPLSDLIISKDCKSFTFGDKTGDAWWKSKGEKTAKQWIKSGELDPLVIAFNMLKTIGSCFKTFPLREDFENWFEFNQAKFEWINKNRPIWTLLYSIRDRIDLTQFNGVTTVLADPKKESLALKYGNGFSFEEFWLMLKPMALTLLQMETAEPGSVLGIKEFADESYRITNIVGYLFTMIFPNVPYNEMIARWKKSKGITELDLYDQLWTKVDSFDGESIDLDNEGF